MSEVSKEELIAFTEAHSKSAVALERITETLENITQKDRKKYQSFYQKLIR